MLMKSHIERQAIEDDSVAFPDAMYKLYKSDRNKDQREIYLKYINRIFDCHTSEDVEKHLLHMVRLMTQEDIGFNIEWLMNDLDRWEEENIRESWAKRFYDRLHKKEDNTLRQIVEKSGLTYREFAMRINEYCGEEIISEHTAAQQIKNYMQGRKPNNALMWIIKKVFTSSPENK